MPDGEIVWLGGKTRDANGYDLAGVFVGSEGTFGIATQASSSASSRSHRPSRRSWRSSTRSTSASEAVSADDRAWARTGRHGDDRPPDDPGGRGCVRLRLPARRRRGAPDRTGRARRRHGGRRPSASSRPAGKPGAREIRTAKQRGRAPAPLEGAQVRLRRLRPRSRRRTWSWTASSRARSSRTCSTA